MLHWIIIDVVVDWITGILAPFGRHTKLIDILFYFHFLHTSNDIHKIIMRIIIIYISMGCAYNNISYPSDSAMERRLNP